jgi:hypothetical protein
MIVGHLNRGSLIAIFNKNSTRSNARAIISTNNIATCMVRVRKIRFQPTDNTLSSYDKITVTATAKF